jgi:hypothetical protein
VTGYLPGATSDGGHEHDLVAVLKCVGLSAEEAEGLVVDPDVV